MTDEQMPEFAPFWHNVAKRRLGFPRCEACGRFHWYPLTRCPHCFAADIEWCAVEPRGTLYSWTVVRHAFAPTFVDRLPYVVGLIEFPDAPGIRLVSEVRAASTDALWILMPVRAVFVGGSGADGLHFIPTTPDERGSQDDGDPCVSSVQ
ncbi:MAG: OB-fold domain-containing protein [Enhydrobacter sp.]|jgi:uncharacterized protein|nr:MAG: OB-fold domain-containing protein [Enhydrobacter sp.]